MATREQEVELSRAQQQNCVFLLQHEGASSIYQSPRSKLLVGLVQVLLGRSIAASSSSTPPPMHGVVALHSQREAPAVERLLQALAGVEVCRVEGHADIVQLRKQVQTAWKDSGRQIYVVSSNCILYLFCLGLWRMEDLDFIVFDNLTPANRNHAYCILMEV